MLDTVNGKDLTTRTNGERLWLARRLESRKTNKPVTQAVAARRLGVCEKLYWMAEQDKVTEPSFALTAGNSAKPTLGDLCALARRRHGKSLSETAAMVGVSVPTFIARERAGAVSLVKAWEALGYIFY